MELSDSDDEGIPIIIVNRNQDLPSSLTSQPNQDLRTPPATQSITVSPPPILTS